MDATSIEILRGDTVKFPVKLRIDGVYQDMTGGTVFFSLKNNATDLDADAVLTKDVAGTSTETWIELTPSETDGLLPQSEYTKYYVGDVQVKLASGAIYSGLTNFTVYSDITRRTT